MSLFLVFAVSVFASSIAVAQPDPDPEKTDSVEYDDDYEDEYDEEWDLDRLDPEDFEIESDLISHYSSGWFPQAHKAASISLSFPMISDVYDRGTNLRSNALVPTTEPFTWRNPYDCGFFSTLFSDCEERRINGDDYPVTGLAEYKLQFLYNLPMPLVLRAGANLQIADGLVFSEDTSRAFLTLSGIQRPFREIGVVYYEQYIVSSEIGLQIPFYGVFFESEAASIASYYYLYGGLSAGYAVSTQATQYSHIADARDQLKYGNNGDTLTLLKESRPEGFNRVRTAMEFALGWHFSPEFVVLGLEAFFSAPLSDVLDDAPWRQYYAGLRFHIGYQWGTARRD